MKRICLILSISLLLILSGCSEKEGIDLSKMNQTEKITWFKNASNDEKKEVLTPQQYHVIVNKQMEASFFGSLTYNTRRGDYYSAICDYHIFKSEDKFKGRSGYLDFENINLSNVQFKEHYRTGQIQVYSVCGEFLGYVEDDDALTSGKHFVINSASLDFHS